jgi:hypothetical protein
LGSDQAATGAGPVMEIFPSRTSTPTRIEPAAYGERHRTTHSSEQREEPRNRMTLIAFHFRVRASHRNYVHATNINRSPSSALE